MLIKRNRIKNEL